MYVLRNFSLLEHPRRGVHRGVYECMSKIGKCGTGVVM